MPIIDDSIDFSVYLRETEHQTKVKPAGHWSVDMKERLRSKAHEKRVLLPWSKARDNFMFRPGEVTLWAGQNGHGKSRMVGQVMLGLMAQGQSVCVANFEAKPTTTLQNYARMFSGTNPFSPEYQCEDGVAAVEALYDEFIAWSGSLLWMYDQMGSADGDTVIGMARYCAKELKLNHVVIDNLAKCVKGEDDYNGQKSFVDEATAIAKDHGVHIHIVHHLKKPPGGEGAIPDKHDTKGSGAITDQPDNLMLVWRNKPKEEDVRKNGRASKKFDEPDEMLLCRKQRNYEGSGDGEPTIALWFHRDAAVFTGASGSKPMDFRSFPCDEAF